MSLEILYGPQLKNKNELLFQSIKNCIDRGENVLYIVPEQYSFNADKILLQFLGEKYSHLTETVNFKRLANLINKKYQPNQTDYIDEETKHLLLYKIIRSNQQKLSTLKKRALSPDSVLIFKSILSECKSNLIEHETLTAIKESLSESHSLYQKISDLDLILTKYQDEIREKFRDFEDGFQLLATYIEENRLYENYSVYLDNFINYSASEYLVIAALLKNAKKVTVTLLSDDFAPKTPGNLFYPSYKTYEHLTKIANKHKKPVTTICIDKESNDSLVSLFEGNASVKIPTHITLTNAKTIRDEVRFVADTIQKKTAEGASFADFTVLSGDLSLYQNEIEMIFTRSNIPYFLDKKTPLTRNPIAKIFLNLFAMVISEYDKNAVLEYLKSLCSLFGIHQEVCIFEELLHRFHLQKKDLSNSERWCEKCNFLKRQTSFLSKNLEKIDAIYQTFLLPVVTNFKKQTSYLESFRKYVSSISLEQACKNYLEKKEAALRQETVVAYNTILNTIKNIDLLIRDDTIEISDYYHILKQALELYESGAIPNTLDTVTVSDVDRGRSMSAKYVFILGLNENITPSAHKNTSYLSDIERDVISEITGISLPTSLGQNCDSLLSLYRAFLSANINIYCSKNESENESGKRMPSFIWKRLEQIFPVETFESSYVNLPEYTQKAIIAYQNPYKQKLNPQKPSQNFLLGEEKKELQNLWSKVSSLKEEGYYSLDKKISKQIINSKYQKKLNASVSRLETYQKCAYAYFINYMLRIQEREDISYDFKKTGSIIHNLFEQFSRSLQKNNLDWETCDEVFIETTIDALVPKEILRLFPDLSLFNPRTKYLIQKIKRLLRRAINYIKEHFTEGDFIPVGYELPIHEDGIPPLTIALEDGSVMQMYGIIDRCDIAKADNRLYVRIVDYKSSAKEFNFALIKDGIQLQLLTYLRTVIKNGGKYLDFSGEILPGAALYTSFGDPLVSFTERPAPDEVNNEIRKKFAMKGLILNDESLIHAIDKNLGELPHYQSRVTDIKTDSKGNLKLKNFLFFEEFNRLLEDCEKNLQSIGNKIMVGDVSIKPYRYGKETGCDWCSYASVCMFDPKAHSYRNISKLSKEAYFQTDKSEEEGEKDGN